MEPRVLRLETACDRLSRDVGRMDADMTHIKETLKHIAERQERDFRLLFGALITVAIALSGLMAKGFGWLS
jgi:hypothetical protein